jgi:hypothetical protein
MLLLPQAEKPQNFEEIQFCSVFELLVVCALYTKTSTCSSDMPQSDEEDSESGSSEEVFEDLLKESEKNQELYKEMQIDGKRINIVYQQLWQLNDYINMMNLYMMMT